MVWLELEIRWRLCINRHMISSICFIIDLSQWTNHPRINTLIKTHFWSSPNRFHPPPSGPAYINSICLSHTWVRCPGFSGHGVKCPILTAVVARFSGDLIGCTIRSQWGPFGDLYLARKNLLCVWNKLFLGEIKFSQWELVLWSLYGDKLSQCRNQQMNGKI